MHIFKKNTLFFRKKMCICTFMHIFLQAKKMCICTFKNVHIVKKSNVHIQICTFFTLLFLQICTFFRQENVHIFQFFPNPAKYAHFLCKKMAQKNVHILDHVKYAHLMQHFSYDHTSCCCHKTGTICVNCNTYDTYVM